jgi:hypothetical protein
MKNIFVERGKTTVQEAAMPVLTAWQNFYVIIGSSAGALTGLMFVVITLLAGSRLQRSSEPVAAFNTPNVFHFGAALFVAAILCAPWQALWNVSLVLGLCGLWGIIYVTIVLRRLRRQTAYTPVLEDWLGHTIFPFIAYIALVVVAIMLPGDPTLALFLTGAATVLLLFIGIHNAWDNVSYLVITQSQPENNSQE